MASILDVVAMLLGLLEGTAPSHPLSVVRWCQALPGTLTNEVNILLEETCTKFIAMDKQSKSPVVFGRRRG